MEINFTGKKALVTGAGRGIGKSIAQQLAAHGAHVICVSRSDSSCSAAAKEIQEQGWAAEHRAVDVSNAESVREAATSFLENHETIDIIVNNAGITKDNLLLRMKDEEWESVVQTNLNSCYYWVRNLLQPMTRKRWGRVLNITSCVALIGNPGQTNYCASKAGMIGYTKSLAREVASRNITANAIAPGFIETDMTSNLSGEQQENIKKNVPLKRLGKPEDISSMATFLLSPMADYITGQVFSIDGGMVM